MTNIVKQYGNVSSFLLLHGNFSSFASESTYCHFHQVQSSQSVLKTGMICPGVNKVGKTKLLNISQSLVPGMFYQVKYKITRNANKTVNRVIDNFSLINKICQLGNFNLQK